MKTKRKLKARRAGLAALPAPTIAKKRKPVSSAIVLTSLAIGAAGILGYLGWQYTKKRRSAAGADLDAALIQRQPVSTYPGINFPLPGAGTGTTTPTYVPKIDADIVNAMNTPIRLPKLGKKKRNATAVQDDQFPLKKGSKGDKVRALQAALINKHGKIILPRYGADGDFGSEMAAALKKLKLPSSVSETLYNVLLQGGGTNASSRTASNKNALGKQLHTAASNKDFPASISLLQQIGTAAEYNTASKTFMKNRLGGVRKTLVNGMLDAFTDQGQKEKIRFEFIRMGLKYNGSKWSLSGLDGLVIITSEPTRIWINSVQCMTVPAHTVLGHQVARRLDYTLFSNNNKLFLVHSKSIRPL